MQEQLGREVAFRELVAHRESRQTLLAGLPAAPAAVARVVWNPGTREAVLLAAGLEPAPPGKVYEAWVIAGGAPVPAGTFQVDASGKAVLRLPTVDETPQREDVRGHDRARGRHARAHGPDGPGRRGLRFVPSVLTSIP